MLGAIAGDDSFLVVADAGGETVAGVVSARTEWTETFVSPIVSGSEEPPSGTSTPGGGWALVANGCGHGEHGCAEPTRELYTSSDPEGPLSLLTSLDGLRGGELFIVGANDDEVVLVHRRGGTTALHAVELEGGAVRELAWRPEPDGEQEVLERSRRSEGDVIHDVARTSYCVAGDVLWAVTSFELNGVPLDPAARAAAPQDVAVVDLGSGEVLDRFSTTAVESRASGIDCTEETVSVARLQRSRWTRTELDRSGAIVDQALVDLARDPDDGIVASEWTGDGYAFLSAPPTTGEEYTTAPVDESSGVGSAPPPPAGTAYAIDRTGTMHSAVEDVAQNARIALSRNQRTFLVGSADGIRAVELSG